MLRDVEIKKLGKIQEKYSVNPEYFDGDEPGKLPERRLTITQWFLERKRKQLIKEGRETELQAFRQEEKYPSSQSKKTRPSAEGWRKIYFENENRERRKTFGISLGIGIAVGAALTAVATVAGFPEAAPFTATIPPAVGVEIGNRLNARRTQS